MRRRGATFRYSVKDTFVWSFCEPWSRARLMWKMRSFPERNRCSDLSMVCRGSVGGWRVGGKGSTRESKTERVLVNCRDWGLNSPTYFRIRMSSSSSASISFSFWVMKLLNRERSASFSCSSERTQHFVHSTPLTISPGPLKSFGSI